MANPRYSPPSERTSPRDRKLQTLQSLMAVSQTGQQSGQEQQMLDQRDQQAKMQALLGMLGLVQSGQQHKDQMQEHTADRTAASTARQNEVNTQALTAGAERNLPGYNEALGASIPVLGEQQQKLQAADAQRKALGLFPVFQAANNNPKLTASLPPVDPATKTALDALLAQNPTPTTPVPTTQPVVQRSGGVLPEPFNPYSAGSTANALLGRQGANDFNQQLIQGNAARRAKMTPEEIYNEQHPLDGLYNFIFGNPTATR